jgi:hypothetical protein
MRLLYLMAIGLILSCLSGCTNTESINTEQKTEDEVQVQVSSPEDGITLSEQRIHLEGNINNQTVKHFFYQIEDGHSFLGDGKIIPDEEGQFNVQINFSIQPSNGHGQLFFYLDEDNNGLFEIETDTKTEIGSLPLRFAESMVLYSSDR